MSAHELTIISLARCQDKRSRNKRESNDLTCSHAKARGIIIIITIIVLCLPCVSLLSGSVKMSRFFSSIPLLQRRRYSVDFIELFCVGTVLTNKLYMKISLPVLSSQHTLRSFSQCDIYFRGQIIKRTPFMYINSLLILFSLLLSAPVKVDFFFFSV